MCEIAVHAAYTADPCRFELAANAATVCFFKIVAHTDQTGDSSAEARYEFKIIGPGGVGVGFGSVVVGFVNCIRTDC